ncbi:hypothetical protein M413DRAFT_133453 [Hebeloma cylindrosporum]|uniref:F-box domain-containing protein n=1 Tax=Hebeloma cylindrosporum TaxID=76867 RepID=A0A0C2XXL0_HEBCY|nr:hypothetical protein M413DRAFT_133453 [Hebeloma cylindrosporum h7]
MVDLPPEIWLRIAHFLPSPTLLGLYTVNGFFLDLAMNERYRVVKFDKLTRSPSNLLARLREPSIARRVLKVTFDPAFIYQRSQQDRAQQNSRISKLIRLVAHRTELGADGKPEKVLPSPSEIEDTLRACIPLMTNVRDFGLEWFPILENIPTPCLDTWLFSLADNLVELRLLVPATTSPRLFLAPPNFPRLRRCSITIFCSRYSEDYRQLETHQIILASFLNSFTDTLQHLALCYCPMRDLSVLFDRLEMCKSLSSLEIDVSLYHHFDNWNPIPASAFIQRNALTLRDLQISTSLPIGPTSTYQFTFNNLQLSNLRSLSISAEVMAHSWEATLSFLETHSSHLESLTVDGPIAPAEVKNLLTSINHTNPCCTLSRLSISIYQLDLKLFTMLAEALTRLQSLRLQISKISSPSKYAVTPSEFFPVERRSLEEKVYPFVDEMHGSYVLKHWDLRDITIERHSCCGKLTLWGLMRLSATCIPSITSFAENGDMVIPEPSNTPPSSERLGVACSGTSLTCSFGRDGILYS